MATLGTQFPKAQLRGGNRINPPFTIVERVVADELDDGWVGK
jgi:hypothetical protein